MNRGRPTVIVMATAVLMLGSPVDATAQLSLEATGDSLLASYNNVEALTAYRQALAKRESFDLLFKAGGAALLVGDQSDRSKEDYFNEAERYSRRLRDDYPERAGSWTLQAAIIGRLAQFRGPREKARVARDVYDMVQKALERDSTYAYAYVVSGILHREVSELGWFKRMAASTVLGGLPPASLEESRRRLFRAIELAPELIPARWEFAKTCVAMGRDDEALVHLRFMQRLSPTNSDDLRLQRKATGLMSEISERLGIGGGR